MLDCYRELMELTIQLDEEYEIPKIDTSLPNVDLDWEFIELDDTKHIHSDLINCNHKPILNTRCINYNPFDRW